MESKYVEPDIATLLHFHFYLEYSKILVPKNWPDFIKFKDMGITCVDVNKYNLYWEYKIIDEKKWNYARIKYEF